MVLWTALKHFEKTFNPTQPDKSNHKNRLLPHFVTSNLEHDSIRLVLEHFEREGLAGGDYIYMYLNVVEHADTHVLQQLHFTNLYKLLRVLEIVQE